jgi:beta-glucuronidase
LEKKLFRILFYLFISLLSPNLLFSQQLFYENGKPSHPDVLEYASSTRSIIDLAGEWDYSLDLGVTWAKVRIPAAADYEGKIVYRKKFIAGSDAVATRAFTFVSYGINYRADVFVNEVFIGNHEGGYTSFELPVPENLIQVGSENVIRIVVDNTLDHSTTFPLRAQLTGWKNYNGIVRDIFIVATPRQWIEHLDVAIEAIEPRAARLTITASIAVKDASLPEQLAGRSFQCSAEVIEASSGTVIGKPFSVPVILQPQQAIQAQIPVTIPNARLWTTDSPELYTIKVSLVASEGKKDSVLDEASVTTGIRTFIKEKNRFLFNGAPITLRGVLWIEDTEQYGSAVSYESMEKDVALIKNLGANVVRVGYNPPHPFFVQLCDRYGLFVLQEIPFVEIPGKILDSESYRAKIEHRYRRMIERDRHHPSIIAWGSGDRIDLSDGAVRSVVSGLQRIAKSLDNRLTYVVARDRTTEIGALADIAAISFPMVDVKTFRSSLEGFVKANPLHPVIVAGYGKAIEKGNRNGYSDPGSQENQARHIQQRYAVVKDAVIAGSIVASFNDHRSDRPIMSTFLASPDRHTNGIVELNREKKVAYDLLHSLYHNQRLSALPIGSYVPATPYLYVVIGLVLLIIAAWLVNGNRRFRESTRRAMLNSYNFFADIRDQFTLPLFHTTVTAAIISVTISVVFSSIVHHFRNSPVLDYLVSFLFPDAWKMIIIRMAWDPALSVVYFSGVALLWFLVLTVLIQLFAKIARVKIRLFHSYSIAVWSALPWTFFIPVGMILYRVLESEAYVPWVLGLIVLTCVWVFLRTLKGISVIYHVYTPKMYMIGIVASIVLFGGLYGYLEYSISLSAYVDLLASTILPFSL